VRKRDGRDLAAVRRSGGRFSPPQAGRGGRAAAVFFRWPLVTIGSTTPPPYTASTSPDGISTSATSLGDGISSCESSAR